MGLDRVVTQPMPSVAGCYEGTLKIIGGAASVWDDANRAPAGDFMAVNDIGMYFPIIQHWYSNHANQLHGWNDVRAFHFPKCESLHSVMPPKDHAEGVTKWDVPSYGSSGLVAAMVGMGLGYEKVILCGVPLSNGAHFTDPRPSNFVNEAPDDRIEWLRDNVFDGRVKSMSGRSGEILGFPE